MKLSEFMSQLQFIHDHSGDIEVQVGHFEHWSGPHFEEPDILVQSLRVVPDGFVPEEWDNVNGVSTSDMPLTDVVVIS